MAYEKETKREFPLGLVLVGGLALGLVMALWKSHYNHNQLLNRHATAIAECYASGGVPIPYKNHKKKILRCD